MDSSSARKNILERIREALVKSPGPPLPENTAGIFYKRDDISLLDKFSSEFTAIDGKLELCRGKSTLEKRLAGLREENGWKRIYCNTGSLPAGVGSGYLPFAGDGAPESADAVITGCECLVARTGTIVLSSAQDYGRALTVYMPVHIVVASIDQLVYDVGDGIDRIIRQYGTGLPSAIFFASGPSRTGDIEKTLVKGVHGPVQVYLFLLAGNEDHALADQPHYQSKVIQL